MRSAYAKRVVVKAAVAMHYLVTLQMTRAAEAFEKAGEMCRREAERIDKTRMPG